MTVTFGSFFRKASALRKCRRKDSMVQPFPSKIGRKNHKADHTDSLGPFSMNLVLTIQFWKHETPPKGANVPQPFRPPNSFNKFMGSMKTQRFVGALRDLDGCLRIHTAQEYRLGTTREFGFGVFGSTKGGPERQTRRRKTWKVPYNQCADLSAEPFRRAPSRRFGCINETDG